LLALFSGGLTFKSSNIPQFMGGGWDGNDIIRVRSLNGNVFGIGGSLNDTIDVIDSKLSILIGDFGQILIGDDWSNNRDLSVIQTAETINDYIGGGYDHLSSLSPNRGVATRSVIIGGSLSDIITSNSQCTVQCGDQCSLQAQQWSVSADQSLGSNDRLSFIGNHQVNQISVRKYILIM
jgi:Ca2+-binding RTX toxin-like protein